MPEQNPDFVTVTQTILKTPENDDLGIYGNCIQAAIASALQKPLDYVPHIGAFSAWPAAMRLWLRGEQLDYTHRPGPEIPEGREMLVGDTKRGARHAVGFIDGQILDPHPSRAGLTKISGSYQIHDWDTDATRNCFVCGSETRRL